MRWQLPMPNTPKITCTESLEATPSGTHVTYRIERPRSAKDRATLESLFPTLRSMFDAGAANLEAVLTDVMAERAAGSNPPEPEIPVSAARHLSDPVESGAVHSS
jgi:hypothetical protein